MVGLVGGHIVINRPLPQQNAIYTPPAAYISACLLDDSVKGLEQTIQVRLTNPLQLPLGMEPAGNIPWMSGCVAGSVIWLTRFQLLYQRVFENDPLPDQRFETPI